MKKWKIFIFLILFFILFLILLGKEEIVYGVLTIFLPFINIGILIGLGALFYFIGKKIGGDKARKEIKKELRKLHLDNPYTYFRDIPNKYGIGVSLSVLNVKITKKDVIAAILDLCAKKYINLRQIGKKFEIIDRNKDRRDLLKNEIYILDWVLNRDSRKINLKKWKILCKEDAILLGLGENSNVNKYNPLFKMDSKYGRDLLIVSYVFSFILLMIYHHYVQNNMLEAIITSLFASLLLTGPVFFIVFLIMLFIGLLYEGKILNYNAKKNSMLKLTNLGKNEYYELCSLGKFLVDFGRFAEKNVNEIVIWEQYLSYAIMFRLNKEIIATGYDKLMINDSFIINDVDRVVL